MAKLYDSVCGDITFPICEYRGYKFARKFFFEGFDAEKISDYMNSLNNMEIREDDVVLMTYPKCGTHLLREVINMLQVGRIEYIGAHVPDFPIEYREMGEVASLKSPRTMHSHLWYSMLPKQLIKENRGKVIALIRNPKDAFVSFWHFNNNREEQSLNIDVFADLYMKGNFYCGGWYEWRNELVKGRKENPKLLVLTYEDCINNLREQVLKISTHMEKTVSDEFIDEIVKACDIKTMREGKRKNVPADVSKFFRDTYDSFYRQGKVGDWKTTLPENVNGELDKWIQSQPDDDIQDIPNYLKFYQD